MVIQRTEELRALRQDTWASDCTVMSTKRTREAAAGATFERYTIVDSESIAQLAYLVESYLAKGWKLQGGVCHSQWRFYQAMVR